MLKPPLTVPMLGMLTSVNQVAFAPSRWFSVSTPGKRMGVDSAEESIKVEGNARELRGEVSRDLRDNTFGHTREWCRPRGSAPCSAR